MRLTKIKEILSKEDLKAVLILNEPNTFYFTGFPRATGTYMLYFEGEAPKFLVPALDYWRALDTLGNSGDVVPYSRYPLEDLEIEVIGGSLSEYVLKEVKGRGVRKVGIDLSPPTSFGAEFREKASKEGIEVVDVSKFIQEVRSIKDEGEIALMKEALRITEGALERVVEAVREGIREKEVAGRLEYLMREGGADWYAFETIVASGPNAAYPHAVPTGKVIRRGEAVVIDTGARFRGYCADLTRTVLVDQPPREVRGALEVVREALLKAQDRVAEGVKAEEVDVVARESIRRSGLGKYFIHSTGHGVGVEIHEYPRVAKGSKVELKEGMVITIEPGIYVPGRYGIRIENMVVVRKKGAEVLNKLPEVLGA